MSSELRTGWLAPSADQLLEDLAQPMSSTVAGARPSLLHLGAPEGGAGASARSFTPRRGGNALKARLVSVDVVAATLAWTILPVVTMPGRGTGRVWGPAIAAIVVTLISMQLLGLYRSRLCAQRGQEAARILIAVVPAAIVFGVVSGDGSRSLGETIIVAGFCLLLLFAFRWGFAQWLCAQRARGHYQRGIVMIGTNDDALEVWTMLHSQPELGYEVRGIVGQSRPCPDWADLPHCRELDRIPDIARITHATGVLVVANALASADIHRVITMCTANDLHVQVCPVFRGLVARRVRRVPMSGETFFYVEPGRRPTWQLVTKRAMDLAGAVLGIIIAAPILVLACIAIRLQDGGPAFYRQERIGSNGNGFVAYKLRSMALDGPPAVDVAQLNERTDGPLFKTSQDPRVTKIGSVIRALSIDELPQLFNVLTGAMSLVGPRPALPHEVDQFDAELLRRHSVRPGITGLWQLEARDNPSFHAYRRLDLLYVDNWSIGLDLGILLATLPMVFAHALRENQPR